MMYSMPKIFSIDFKMLIVNIVNSKLIKISDIVKYYKVSKRSIQYWKKNLFIEMKKYNTTKRKINKDIKNYIIKYV